MTKKISLSFVNDGKEFIMPNITVGMQEKLFEDMLKYDKDKMPIEVYNSKMNRSLILSALQQIDPSVTDEHIGGLHPEDFMELFTNIWEGGRELTKDDDGNFRKKKK